MLLLLLLLFHYCSCYCWFWCKEILFVIMLIKISLNTQIIHVVLCLCGTISYRKSNLKLYISIIVCVCSLSFKDSCQSLSHSLVVFICLVVWWCWKGNQLNELCWENYDNMQINNKTNWVIFEDFELLGRYYCIWLLKGGKVEVGEGLKNFDCFIKNLSLSLSLFLII